MKTVDSLINIQEKVSEETFQEIMQITEGLFINDGRGDLFDDVSKLITGKPVMHHVRKGATKALKLAGKGTTKIAKFVGNKIKKAIENRKARNNANSTNN